MEAARKLAGGASTSRQAPAHTRARRQNKQDSDGMAIPVRDDVGPEGLREGLPGSEVAKPLLILDAVKLKSPDPLL